MKANNTNETDDARSIDRLYALPLGEFVGERNALASQLRKAGARERADVVKSLDKPSATAWAVNQAWWTHKAQFEAMIEAGARLRAAHQALRDGKAPELRPLIEARQTAIDAVVAAAVGALGGPGEVGGVIRDRIVGTCEALATSGVPNGIALGRLTGDLRSTGLDVLSALAASMGGPGGAAQSPAATRPRLVRSGPPAATCAPGKTERRSTTREADDRARRAEEAKAEEAKAALAAAQSELNDAQVAAQEASRSEAAAKVALAQASTRLRDLETALEEARDAERAARRALGESTRAASSAEFTRVQATRAVDRLKS